MFGGFIAAALIWYSGKQLTLINLRNVHLMNVKFDDFIFSSIFFEVSLPILEGFRCVAAYFVLRDSRQSHHDVVFRLALSFYNFVDCRIC